MSRREAYPTHVLPRGKAILYVTESKIGWEGETKKRAQGTSWTIIGDPKAAVGEIKPWSKKQERVVWENEVFFLWVFGIVSVVG